jgi:hypothetical protein
MSAKRRFVALSVMELSMSIRDHSRALRYRELALAQSDRKLADLLNGLAEETEGGTLFIAMGHKQT